MAKKETPSKRTHEGKRKGKRINGNLVFPPGVGRTGSGKRSITRDQVIKRISHEQKLKNHLKYLEREIIRLEDDQKEDMNDFNAYRDNWDHISERLRERALRVRKRILDRHGFMGNMNGEIAQLRQALRRGTMEAVEEGDELEGRGYSEGAIALMKDLTRAKLKRMRDKLGKEKEALDKELNELSDSEESEIEGPIIVNEIHEVNMKMAEINRLLMKK